MANPKSKTARKAVIFSLIILVIGGLSAAAFFRKREVIITVQTEKVARRNLTELVVATGKIQPVVQVVINPEVSGEIIALPVKEGQPVKKGELIHVSGLLVVDQHAMPAIVAFQADARVLGEAELL